ncbi:MAG: hypothetical protein QOI95_2166 [Acidimicrobiaceae bacterium]|jgi:hypothetical protein
MQIRRTGRLFIAGTVLTGTSLLGLAGTAEAQSPRVIQRGKCSAASTFKLKLQQDDRGRLEAEYEVDQNVNGAAWDVTLTDNGTQVFAGEAVTKAPSGSFDVKVRFANNPGADTLAAHATNPATGETCGGTVTLG